MKRKKAKKDTQELIRILSKTKRKIESLAKARGLKQITVLEYLLKGKIPLNEL